MVFLVTKKVSGGARVSQVFKDPVSQTNLRDSPAAMDGLATALNNWTTRELPCLARTRHVTKLTCSHLALAHAWNAAMPARI